MKIVFVITDLGSFNNFLSELALELIKSPNVDLHVICSNHKVIDISDKNKFNDNNFHLHFIDIPRSVNFLRQINAAYKIKKLISLINPDLIHSHFTTGIFPTILFKNKGLIYWGTFHGLGMNSSIGIRKILFSIVENLCFYRLDRIFLVNNEDYTLVKNKNVNTTYKYECKGFGCDVKKFSSSNFSFSDRLELKKNLKLTNKFVICFVGRFVNFKGFNIVIRTFIELAKIYPDKFKLLLLGGFDPIHESGLSEKEHSSILENENIITIGYTNEVPKYLNVSDLFLFPSKKEGLPTCVMEALSMGLPVITMDSRGNNDLIVDGENGLLIESSLLTIEDEINEIIKSIEKIYFSKDLQLLLRKNALKQRDSISRNRFIEEHKFMYNQIQS